MEIINLTPHKIIIGEKAFEPTGSIARCHEEDILVSEINGIPVITRTYGDVTGVPDEKVNTVYIVSALVRMALPKRHDLLSPGKLVRNEKGDKIIYVSL